MSPKVKDNTIDILNRTWTFRDLWIRFLDLLKKIKKGFGMFFLWFCTIAIGFIPFLLDTVQQINATKVSNAEVWMDGMFGDLDVLFSLVTVFYALYLQGEQLSKSQKQSAKFIRITSVAIVVILLLAWIILSVFPTFKDVVLYTTYSSEINLAMLFATVIYGIFSHIVFSICE